MGALRRVVRRVALLNLGYFVVALAIGSVSLLADSVDFLENASVNLVILLILGWGAKRRALVGMSLAGLLVPVLATLWTAWSKLGDLLPPNPSVPMLARHRGGDSLTRAAFCRRATTRWSTSSSWLLP